MQSLQRTLQSIGVQLRGLPPTAKLLIGSLMIILVMSLFLVSLYAGRQEMEPLGLRRDVSSAIKAEAINYLQARDIPYQERGDDVLVPSDRKIAVLAQLTENQLIDGDQINFDLLMGANSYRFTGKIADGKMDGSAVTAGSARPVPWRAAKVAAKQS